LVTRRNLVWLHRGRAVCGDHISWFGRLLDRVPARRVVLPCLVIYALGFASLSLVTRYWWHLLAIYIVMGVTRIPTTQLGYARVVSTWFDPTRGRALAAVMAGSGIGFMVFPPGTAVSHLELRLAGCLRDF
jgi:MFS family permease